ncbi:MAG: hypothetical protein LBQ74_03745 [Prevotella sp.]|jgi:t-SNARE complex subunit (syntaxin)|nr:hypothetical protein [Prevotella sp.]
MNNARRKKIEDINDELGKLLERLEELRDEEQEAYDNLPEGIQDSERGENMYNAIDNIESAISSMEEIADYLNEAIA